MRLSHANGVSRVAVLVFGVVLGLHSCDIAVHAQADSCPPGLPGPVDGSQQGLFGRRRLLQQDGDKYCYIAFNINDPRIGVECDATACSMTPGGKNVVCEKIVCECLIMESAIMMCSSITLSSQRMIK
eukprot:jgi/Picre1/27248/NNA_000217.t1